MSRPDKPAPDDLSSLTERPVTVLLVDDQAIIGEAVRRLLAGEKDIVFHYCQDPTEAIKTAVQVRPTVILQDLVMPEIDGLTLLRFFKANEATRDIPLIVLSTKEEPKVKAEAFGLGANDYLVKLPDKIELIARIRHHSAGYINLIQRNEAYRALEESQRALSAELNEAAAYLRSLIPPPMAGPIETDWRFIPSKQLGGDIVGYHWVDDDHLAIYVIDVCGHGVGPSLLSVSVVNVLRAQTLPQTDFRQPAEVLGALSEAFDMEKQNNTYFTMWYGVYDRRERLLTYASGGHPPAILLSGSSPAEAEVHLLSTDGFVVGGLPGVAYHSGSQTVGAFGKLFVYSDGVYEIKKTDGTWWLVEEFVEFMSRPSEAGRSDIDRLVDQVRRLSGSETMEDDFTMLEVLFH